jgi:hypothetical protein
MTVEESRSCPDVVLGAIAWYPDQLDEERRALVEAHAAECPACREEIRLVQGEIEPDAPLPDADELYTGVLARIEENEAGDSAALHARGSRRGGDFGDRPGALAAGIALAILCGAVGIVGGLWLREPAAPTYQTVSETPAVVPVAAAAGSSLDVVFRPDATVEDLRAALRAVGGQIVSGPTELGVYRVELAPSGDQAAAARVLRGEERGVATFAEPAVR